MAEQWLLRNEHLQVEVDADTLTASVLHLASGLRWQFRTHDTGEVHVSHGTGESTVNWSDARIRTLHRVVTSHEQRLAIFAEGLPGGVAATITFALPNAEPVLRVEVEAGVLVGVLVGVFVGRAMAVCVNPAAKVLTAEVWIAPTLRVGVGSGWLAPQALNARLPRAARIIRMINLSVFFIFSYSFH